MSVAEAMRPAVRNTVRDDEWAVRVELAALYRLVALHGWDDLIYTHISARVPGAEEHFLINPYGLLFEEITASSLVKVDLDGNILQKTDYFINPAGYTIHSAVHGARSDVGCVMHLHTDDGVAVASQPHGLLMLSQHAMAFEGRVAYHDYEGIAVDLDERERLVADLGDKPVMILRNHGTLAVGANCADAFMAMYFLERACSIQVRTLAGGGKWVKPPKGVAAKVAAASTPLFSGPAGDLAWPALLRKLDRIDPSFRD